MASMEEGSSSPPAPGWYADPGGQGLRWWDGTSWTEQVRPLEPTGEERPGRYPLRYALLDRWPVALGGIALIAAAVVAILLLRGGDGSGDAREEAVRGTVDQFLAAVARGDERACRRFVDTDARAVQEYLRLAEDVPGSQATCGFVGATGGRVAALTIADVTVEGRDATATFEDNPTEMHLSEARGEWMIDGIR